MAFYTNRTLALDRGAKQRPRRSPRPVGGRVVSALRREEAGQHSPPRFPLARSGYDRVAVDGRVLELEQELAALDRELAELRARRDPAQEVASEIKRVGEQTSAVLIAAQEQREEILRQARAEADRCLAEAKTQARAVEAKSEARLRKLEVQNQAARRERDRLVEGLRTVSAGLATVAASADEALDLPD